MVSSDQLILFLTVWSTFANWKHDFHMLTMLGILSGQSAIGTRWWAIWNFLSSAHRILEFPYRHPLTQITVRGWMTSSPLRVRCPRDSLSLNVVVSILHINYSYLKTVYTISRKTNVFWCLHQYTLSIFISPCLSIIRLNKLERRTNSILDYKMDSVGARLTSILYSTSQPTPQPMEALSSSFVADWHTFSGKENLPLSLGFIWFYLGLTNKGNESEGFYLMWI